MSYYGTITYNSNLVAIFVISFYVNSNYTTCHRNYIFNTQIYLSDMHIGICIYYGTMTCIFKLAGIFVLLFILRVNTHFVMGTSYFTWR